MRRTIWAAVAAAALMSTQATMAQPSAEMQALQPNYGRWGFDLAGENPAIKPGDDFFAFANGRYVDQLKIPPDQNRYGSFNLLRDLSEARVRAILDEASSGASADGPAAKIGDAYRAFMDEARVNGLGASPLGSDLQTLRALSTKEALARLMGASAGTMFFSLFDVDVGPDDKDPNHYAVQIAAGGLGLPDRDYYLQPAFAAKKAAYLAYIEKMLGLVGWSDPSGSAQAILAFETSVAAAHWTRAEMRDPDAVYNPLSPAELQSFAPGFDWAAYLQGAELAGAPRLLIDTKSAFPKLAAVYAQTSLSTLKAWEAFHLADSAAPYLSTPFVRAQFEFRDHELLGQIEDRPRWKHGVSTVDRQLGDAIGQIYVARYFPPDSKAQMEALIANLKLALGERIKKLSWMSPATKQEALRKLARYDVQVGYPKKWRDYSGLQIRADDLFGNVERSAAFEWNYRRSRLHEPVDKDEWLMTPQTVNAYNNPVFNEVVFPAAILQPPFFSPRADAAVNYGAIGAVIGHEMTHGFDDQGRKYDAEGRLKDWWTPDDARNFEARASKLAASYEALPVAAGAHINGRLTLGENIADLGGVLTALDAYHASLRGAQPPVIDGLTGDQRFFLGFAQIWRSKTREDALRQQLVTDPHSPEKARINGVVPNVDDWYAVFHVKPGDAMYRTEEERTLIW